MLFIKVSEIENEESIELPVEPQGYLLMSTLTAQFPGACGLKFKTEQFSWRGVRVVEDKLYPPDDKWDTNVYIVTYPKDSKRKGDDLDINSAKSRKIERKCVDLIVLGIPWKSTEDAVRRYFEQYGDVVLCEIKRDASGISKGFGFVRFKEYSHQCNVLGKKHFIDGRWCDVKIPNSQEPETSRKIFVGRLSETITAKDLQDYFNQFGQVIDVYIPKPFRAFGFVTFVEAEVAQSLCGESHIIKGASVHVSKADPKEDDRHRNEPIIPTPSSSSSSMRRFPSNSTNLSSSGGGGGGHHHHHHHHNNQSHNSHHMSSSMSANAIVTSSGSNQSSKSMPSRNKKFDSHGAIDVYDRQHDIRSPNMPQSHHHNHHHHNSQNSHHSHQSHEQMSAMMNMFNPMIAAFMQQLASGMQPSAGTQSTIDTHNGAPQPINHHHSGPHPPPWATPTDYSRNNPLNAPTSINTGIPSGYGSSSGYSGSQHNPRFKSEKF